MATFHGLGPVAGGVSGVVLGEKCGITVAVESDRFVTHDDCLIEGVL